VRKLNQDLAAVKNALSEGWRKGPVEGQINRLKTLKRQMYGRLRTFTSPIDANVSWLPPAPKLRKNLIKEKRHPCNMKLLAAILDHYKFGLIDP
jgi:hypothetical protein